MSSPPKAQANQITETTSTPIPETNNDAVVQDEQTPSNETDEKVEKKSQEVNDSTSSVKSSNNQNLPGPSTSKETSTTRQAPESFNIYMQLKKKTYFDFYENDKRSDGPQDLSCSNKSNTESKGSKLELDGDIEMTDAETESRNQATFDSNQQQNHSGESSSGTTIRPQIIVSPRKSSSAFIKTVKNENNDSSSNSISNEGSGNSQLSTVSNEGTAAQGTSPSKSVIVRIGHSSMVSDFICNFFLLFCY